MTKRANGSSDDVGPYLEIYFDGGWTERSSLAESMLVLGGLSRHRLRRLASGSGNQAEFRALRQALAAAVATGAPMVRLIGDSKLAVDAMNGRARIRSPALRDLLASCRRVAGSDRRFVFVHVGRRRNHAGKALTRLQAGRRRAARATATAS